VKTRTRKKKATPEVLAMKRKFSLTARRVAAAAAKNRIRDEQLVSKVAHSVEVAGSWIESELLEIHNSLVGIGPALEHIGIALATATHKDIARQLANDLLRIDVMMTSIGFQPDRRPSNELLIEAKKLGLI
jgi:hypothetical protein